MSWAVVGVICAPVLLVPEPCPGVTEDLPHVHFSDFHSFFSAAF